ncbi:hypothetical protein NQ315_008636 [Exocentrus adspersus]|uniref:Uncharacterized protein n=1 Tax=Exocentrus adspersus TaxID=1586481 RepID=A0AAV8W5R6_9CUCU|nr:hypothetical protein NQ315_008636 [Exocentrus adspersus]
MTSSLCGGRVRFFCILFGLGAVLSEEEKVFRVTAGTDSYLEAYKATRGNNVNALLDDAVKKTDRQYVESGPGVEYTYQNPQPQFGLPQGYNYGPPKPQYGPPNPGPAYGPPSQVYGPPVYGPPNPPPPPPVYGPPSPPPPPVYGPPPSSSITQVFYGVPHAMLSFWDKLKLKLDLFTIGKIILKLVIFKKIVSFIAIICLLLFIPALKHKKLNFNTLNFNNGGGTGTEPAPEDEMMDEEEDMLMMRNWDGANSLRYQEKLNNLTAYILGAIEDFSKREGSRGSCENVYCGTQRAVEKLDKIMSYERLAKMYSKELQS